MAVATATAIALGGLAVSAATSGASFAQASKQKKMQRQAEAEADKALQEARQKLDVNFYEQLGINKEAYELEREALLSSGAQAIEAGVESERGAAAVAGRVQMAQQQGQGGVRTAMSQELQNLDKLVASEDARLRDAQANLDLAEAQGAQLAARDAQEASAAATAQGMAGLQSLGQQAIQMAPLYEKSAGAKQFQNLQKQATAAGMTQQQFQTNLVGLSQANPQFANLSGVGYTPTGYDAQGKPIQGMMTPYGFQDYMSGLGADYLKLLGQTMFPQKK
jgi:hypothetical protein